MTTEPLISTISPNFWSFPHIVTGLHLVFLGLLLIERQHTVTLFLNLEGDRLPGHLQEVDGLAQRLPFQTDAIDGQDSVPYVDGPGPAGGRGGGAEVRDYTRRAASLDADNDASCSRSRRHGRDLSNNRE